MGFLIRTVAALLLLAGGAGAWAQADAYQGPVFEDPALSAVELTPSWRAALDAPSAVLVGDTLYYLSAGELIAADVASGEQLWRYGASLAGPLAAMADLVLVGGEALIALNASSGEVAWRYQQEGLSVRTITPLAEVGAKGGESGAPAGVVIGGNYGEGGAVLNADGSLRFRIGLFGIGGPVLVEDGVLYWQASYGEPHFEHVHALDLGSGTELWRAGRSAGPLAVRDGVAYLLDADWSRQLGRPPFTQEIVLVNARSGAELARWLYESPDRSGYVPASAHRLFLYGERLYIVRADGGAVAEFPLGGAAAPIRLFEPSYHRGAYRLGSLPDQRQGAPQPARQGLLLFETDVHELRGVTVPGVGVAGDPEGGAGGDTDSDTDSDTGSDPAGTGGARAPAGLGADIGYAGPGSPISRLDLLSGTLYVGRTDGLLTAIDLHSARRHYFVATGGFGFGPVLEADSHVVLQTTDEIMVVKTGAHAAGTGDAAPVGARAAESVTLVTQYGTEVANADRVAVRDGAGPWRALAGHAGSYTFAVESGSYSLAVLCYEESGPVLTLYSFRAAELPYLRHACGGASELLTAAHELHGAVRGLELPPTRPWDLFDLAFGRTRLNRYLLRADAPVYSLMAGPGVGDLLALRTPTGAPPDRAVLRRDLAVEGPTRVDLDFDGPEAIELERYRLRPPQTAPDALVRAQLRTCNGSVVEVSQAGAVVGDRPAEPGRPGTPADATRYAALPLSERRACDRYELSALEVGPEGEFRFQALFLAEPRDAQLTLPALPPAAAVAFAPGAWPALRAEWAPRAGASIYLFTAALGGTRWLAFQSASLPPSLELPVLADLPGWPGSEASGGAPTDLAFGVIASDAGAWETLLAWERALGDGRLPGTVPVPVRFSAALAPVAVQER